MQKIFRVSSKLEAFFDFEIKASSASQAKQLIEETEPETFYNKGFATITGINLDDIPGAVDGSISYAGSMEVDEVEEI